jgi:DNA-binding Lrp family transcriptional regulator
MPTTLLSAVQAVEAEKKVLRVLEEATEPDGLKIEVVAERVGLSERAVCEYLKRLRGKGKVERFRGKGHDVFFRRRRAVAAG